MGELLGSSQLWQLPCSHKPRSGVAILSFSNLLSRLPSFASRLHYISSHWRNTTPSLDYSGQWEIHALLSTATYHIQLNFQHFFKPQMIISLNNTQHLYIIDRAASNFLVWLLEGVLDPLYTEQDGVVSMEASFYMEHTVSESTCPTSWALPDRQHGALPFNGLE